MPEQRDEGNGGSPLPLEEFDISAGLPDGFANSVPLQGFKGFLLEPDGNIHFGLLGVDGNIHYFRGTADVLSIISQECAGLSFASREFSSNASQQVEKSGAPSEFEFETSHVITLIPQGNGTSGKIEFHFYTKDNVKLWTLLSPEIAAQMVSNITNTLSAMPTPPEVFELEILRAKLPGKAKEVSGTKVYFGQQYQVNILQILGVMIIRASILEAELVKLLSALAEIDPRRAEAIFYATQNNKARIDLISALLPTSGINEVSIADLKKALDKVLSISNRRNMLVHGEWEFKKDKFIVREKKSALKSQSQDPIVSYKSIERLAGDYHDSASHISFMADQIPAWRTIASKT